jgi:hypothetical protein
MNSRRSHEMRPKDHMPVTRFWFVVLASAALLLAACGGTETDKNTTSAAPGATQPTTPAKQKFDFGDAPDPLYPTNLKSDGARHKDITRAWLGRKVDAESLAGWQDDILAYTGDEFDDGLMAAGPLEFAVTNNDWDGPLYVNVLVDFNKDGDWADEDEWRIQNFETDVPMGETMEFATEFVFDELMWLRITLTGKELESYDGTGEFAIGESEDHIWSAQGSTGKGGGG